MKNVLLDKGIILPSGEISKDKVNLVTGAITQPFPKGKRAVIANAVLARGLGLHPCGAVLYQPGENRRYPGSR